MRRPVIIRGVSDGEDLRHDIGDRADCERLVRAFYGRAMVDPVIGWLFVDVARLDLEEHVPVITSFWETILLGAQTYGGGAFGVHANLNRKAPMQAGHFVRWLTLWNMSVDELFVGVVADEAKRHAERVANAFHRRLEGMVTDVPATPPGPGGLAVTQHGGG